MHKVLVTGANGQLGRVLKEEVAIFQLNNPDYEWHFKGKDEVNICDYEEVEAYVLENEIDIIINCAALTNVDDAEIDKDAAKEINVTGTQNLADISNNFGVYLIHISTDYVFSGERVIPYTEEDVPTPVNYYGLTKLWGEEAIKKRASEYIIIRTSFLYSEYGNNFLTKMISAIDTWDGDTIRKVVNDQISSPTYARDLCYAILRCLEYAHKGVKEIVHFANKGVCSRYDFAKLTEMIYKPVHFVSMFSPCKSSDFERPARRPVMSVLDTTKAANMFDYQIPHWVESLKICIEKYKLGNDE